MFNARKKIGLFNKAFGRPVNCSLAKLTVSERELLGKILMEEVVETLTKGLGLTITATDSFKGCTVHITDAGLEAKECAWDLSLNEGQPYDPVETGDGLGDINVVIHFMAHWCGMNLDALTDEINDSNMSKLAEDGTPIVNGETEGYREGQPGFDPSRPVGKILKSPMFRKPNIEKVLSLGNAGWNAPDRRDTSTLP